MPIKADELEIGDYVPGEFVVLDVVKGVNTVSAYIETVTGARYYKTWDKDAITKLIR